MKQHHSDDGNISGTFQVSMVKRHYGKYAYVSRSNAVILTVPAP